MLTLDQLIAMPPDTAFATGVVENSTSPEGIYMTNNDIGRKLIWVAVRGGIEDWSITCHWEDWGYEFALTQGDKVTGEKHIRKLVPCTDEAYKMYRR